MKIIKIANMNDKPIEDAFSREGVDPLENIGERDLFEAKHELSLEEIGRKGQNHTSEVMKEISKALPERITSWWVANGSVAWFKYTDGVIYEVTVSPAAHGHHFNVLKEEMNPKQNNPDPDDQLPM